MGASRQGTIALRPRTPGASAPAAARMETPASVDLGRPIVPQVRALAQGYDAWVHRALSPGAARTRGSLRLFRSDRLEALSHTPWWLIPLFWGPVIVGLVLLSSWRLGLSAGHVALHGVGGLLVWTLLEYGIHRFVFHWRPRGPFGRQLHFLGHGVHHLDPWDPLRLVLPPALGLLLAAPVFGALLLLLPAGPALATMAGILVGYVAYDMIHYHVHHRPCRTRWGKFLKRWHLAHHHKHPTALFGVSSPLWDWVFRTGRPV